MDRATMDAYTRILREELVCAMGCTEPIAIAYAAALARETLGCLPNTVDLSVSPNIIKNVKSVVVPHTGGLKGMRAAASAGISAGIIAGDAAAELEVLAKISPDDLPAISAFLERASFSLEPTSGEPVLDIRIRVETAGHSAYVRIAGAHTNVVRVERDGEVLVDRSVEQADSGDQTDRNVLSIEGIVEYADTVTLDEVAEVLERQISCNTAIADAGFTEHWGAGIGRVLMDAYGGTVHNRAKAAAAAGSDARMSGCELPVVINSGSGNQGITASLPVIVFAREMGVSHELLLRALVVSNLTHRAPLRILWRDERGVRCRRRHLLPPWGQGRRDRPHRGQRRRHQLGHDLRRRQAELRGQDRLRRGGRSSGLADAGARRGVLRRRRHRGQGR